MQIERQERCRVAIHCVALAKIILHLLYMSALCICTLHYVGSVATIQYGSPVDADGNYS